MKWPGVDHFESEEFSSPDLPGSGEQMKLVFVERLDKVRKLVGRPLIINSGFRTEAHNAKVGGVDSSSHTKGWAADIRVEGSGQRLEVVHAALAAGFRRIGVARTFVHVDEDPGLPEGVLWLY